MDQASLRVLVVDDDMGAANALGRLLRAYGHEVHILFGPVEAVDAAVTIRPHLILLDIAMPVMDGYEVARRLRATPEVADTVLVACSGSVDEQTARQAGFDGWLIKPIGVGELETVIAMVLERIRNDKSDCGPTACHKQPK